MATRNTAPPTRARRVAGRALQPPVHHVPSSWAFVELVSQGLCWGMVPQGAAREATAAGRLVALVPEGLDVPLFWQHRRISAPSLADLTARVARAARAALHPL